MAGLNNTTIPTSPPHVSVLREFRHDAGVVIGALGIILNSLVMLGFSTTDRILSKTPRRIVINQSMVDFTLSIFLIVSQYRSSYISMYLPLDGVGPSPVTYCRVLWSAYMVWALIDVSSYNLVVLTLERYISVCHPFKHATICAKKFNLAALVFVWLAGFSFASLNIVFTKYVVEDRSCYWESEKHPGLVFTIAHAHFALFIPVILMIYCYARMFKVLKARVSTGDEESRRKAHQIRSFVITCLFTCIGYFICFSLNTIWFFLSSTGLFYLDFQDEWYHLSIIMAFANCFINPVIYLIRIAAFRQQLLYIFLRRARNTPDEAASHTAETLAEQAVSKLNVPHQ